MLDYQLRDIENRYVIIWKDQTFNSTDIYVIIWKDQTFNSTDSYVIIWKDQTFNSTDMHFALVQIHKYK